MASLVIETDCDSECLFFPVNYRILHFNIETSSDANLFLTTTEDCSEPSIGFFIGCQNNTETVITKNGETIAKKTTHNILSSCRSKGFWIKWDNGLYQLGLQGQYQSLIAAQDNTEETLEINFIGVKSTNPAIWNLEINEGVQAEPSQLIPCIPKWSFASKSRIPIPANAFIAGCENENDLMIGRAYYNGALTPGKILDERLFIAWGGQELSTDMYEVLCDCDNSKFVSMKGTDPLPEHAFIAGIENEHYMYVARVCYEGQVILGKYYPHYGLAYIPFKGSEKEFAEFEILVCKISNPENFDFINASSIASQFETTGNRYHNPLREPDYAAYLRSMR